MPSKNKTNKGRHSPEQQPSLLDQIELDEEQASETQAPENHLPEEPGQESPGHGDGADQRSAEPEAKTADPQLPEYEERHAPPEQPSEPLKRAYDRYVEIVGATYSSTFSDAKRQAAFKEAARTHRVKISDLKRYSTAAALGIPFHHNADSEAGTAPLDHQTE